MKVQILTALSLAAAATAEILYPSALDAAAIAPPQVSDLNREALTLGNGDLNALL